jgi:hypothetical protein
MGTTLHTAGTTTVCTVVHVHRLRRRKTNASSSEYSLRPKNKATFRLQKIATR